MKKRIFLLFGSLDVTNEVKGEVKLKAKQLGETSDSRCYIITLNRYGFIDIVELKKSDAILFKYDKSPDTFYPSPELSKAISQLLNYLMILLTVYMKGISEDINDKKIQIQKGAASGLLILDSARSLLSSSERNRIRKKRGITDEKLDQMLKKYLRELNYSLSHIEIITYDELLENLKSFSYRLNN